MTDDTQRPPNRGRHLSDGAKRFIDDHVERLVYEMHDLAERLVGIRYRRSDRSWRRENLTDDQRKAIAKATKRVRHAAKRWIR